MSLIFNLNKFTQIGSYRFVLLPCFLCQRSSDSRNSNVFVMQGEKCSDFVEYESVEVIHLKHLVAIISLWCRTNILSRHGSNFSHLYKNSHAVVLSMFVLLSVVGILVPNTDGSKSTSSLKHCISTTTFYSRILN